MKDSNPGALSQSRAAQKARDRRIEKSVKRGERLRSKTVSRRPTPVDTAPGGPRHEPGPVIEFIPKYRVNGEWKLFTRRTMDYIDPEQSPRAILWSKGPRRFKPEMTIINGRSDKTGAVSPGRKLPPEPEGHGGSLKTGAVDAYFGESIPKCSDFSPRDGFAASRRSMSRPGYRAVGR